VVAKVVHTHRIGAEAGSILVPMEVQVVEVPSCVDVKGLEAAAHTVPAAVDRESRSPVGKQWDRRKGHSEQN